MDGDGVLSKYVAPISPPAPVIHVFIGNATVYVVGVYPLCLLSHGCPRRRREFEDAVTDVLGWAMVEENRQQQHTNTPELDSSLLFKIFVASFVPFMGFGFVDNFMMVRTRARLVTGALCLPRPHSSHRRTFFQPGTRLPLTRASLPPDF
jgi:hypothetical protein